MCIYYVYAYLRSSNNTPYYIGKGKNNRAYDKHNHISTPKDKSKIVFLETNLSEIGALALERRYIRWYGRKNSGNGILLNMTDGGEGVSGYKHTDETKQKLSKPLSEEHKQKLSDAKKGKTSPFKGKKLGKKDPYKITEKRFGKRGPYGKQTNPNPNRFQKRAQYKITEKRFGKRGPYKKRSKNHSDVPLNVLADF
jgi:NUMOD3 motif